MNKLRFSILLLAISPFALAIDKIDNSKLEINESKTNGIYIKNNEQAPSLNDLINQKSISDEDKEGNFRLRVIKDTAYTLGFRGGVVNKSNELISILNSRADKLDLIFNFSSLISEDGVLPPVIVEASDVATFSKDQIRVANHLYKIKIEERFVSNPPTWLDYLFTGLSTKFTDDYIPEGIKPKNNKEMKVWKESVKSGWEDGQKFAIDILEANFNRLVRDYTGMMRYSELLQQRMITKSKTARSVAVITGDKKQIILGDELQRLIEKASFELDVDKWRPASTIKTPDNDY